MWLVIWSESGQEIVIQTGTGFWISMTVCVSKTEVLEIIYEFHVPDRILLTVVFC